MTAPVHRFGFLLRWLRTAGWCVLRAFAARRIVLDEPPRPPKRDAA